MVERELRGLEWTMITCGFMLPPAPVLSPKISR
jgi:hypothetical protein